MQLHLDGECSPLTCLHLNILASNNERRRRELISISMVDIAVPLLVTDGNGIKAARETLVWLYVNSASTVP
jgi:hypothetical protein